MSGAVQVTGSNGEDDVLKDFVLKDFVGMIWIGQQPGQRFRVAARSLAEAKEQAESRYGKGHVISIYNEDDADRVR